MHRFASRMPACFPTQFSDGVNELIVSKSERVGSSEKARVEVIGIGSEDSVASSADAVLIRQ